MKTPIQANRYFQIAIASTGFIFLILGFFYTNFSIINPVFFLLLIILSGLLIQFPIRLLKFDFFLIHIVAILGSLISDPAITASGILLGVFIGYLFRWLIPEKKSWKDIFNLDSWRRSGFIVGLNIIPLATLFFFLEISPSLREYTVDQYWKYLLFVNIIFMLLQGIIFYFNFLTTEERVAPYPNQRSDIFSILKIDIFSIVFIFVIMAIFSKSELEAIILFAGMPIITAYLLNKLNSLRSESDRRDQELSTLNHVSQTIQSTLNLDKLLPVIQEQVMQLLDVNNFYVALYDDKAAEIWYPFAMKNGQKQDWLSRPISDRLTDRVIQNGQAILFSPQKKKNGFIDELPTSDETPVSWLGVPLITSERTIGCMAVFSLQPGKYFSDADHDVMTILSGQAGVAIQNALLYQQTEHRAYQLEILNQLTTTMTASLNLTQVLTQVSNSVTQVVGNEKSAIYLVEPGDETASLAHVHGLSDEFQKRNAVISTKKSRRARCLQTGMPEIISDIQNSSIPSDLALHYKADKIQSFADFPLITPDGQVGFLSVYFAEKHDFPKEEVGLLQTFASQAALAVSNARLHSQTDAALAQRVNQLTTLEAVSRDLIAASHSDQLYGLILRYALEMTNSCCGAVSIINPESHLMEIMASKGYGNEKDNFSFHNRVTTGVSNFGVKNIEGIRENQGFPGSMNGNIRSQLSVPIIHEERLLGEIAIASTELSAYSESEHSFVSQLANHAAINIINAELYHELQNRLQEQSTLYRVSAQLVRDLHPEQVVEAVKQAIYSIINPLEIGIYIWHQETGSHQLIGETSYHNPTTIDSSHDLIRYLLKESHPKAIETENPLKPIVSAGCNNCQIYAFPFGINQQRPGFLTLHLDENNNISENEAELIKTIAAQGAISFLNAQNYLEVKNVRDRLSAILNSIEEGILMIDIEGCIHIANTPIEKLTGFKVEEFLGRQILELPNHLLDALGFNHAEINMIFQNLSNNQIVTAPKTNIDSKHVQRNLIVERTTMPIWGQNSKIIGIIILIRDITEEREIEQTRDAITETIVHDVRSPMSAIVGALELLKDVLSDTENSIAEQALLVAERSANRVISLTEELLDIARLQSGRMDITTDDIDFQSLVEELMIDFTAIANENSVFIRNNVPKKTPLVRADPDKLIRILTNLVENAIKFSPHGGHVIISASSEGSQFLTVRITDNGAGIPPDYKEKIFDRFVQVPGQYSRRGGTGLGLAFCRLAVEAHGGQIWVDHNPDGGSIFAFTIPTI